MGIIRGKAMVVAKKKPMNPKTKAALPSSKQAASSKANKAKSPLSKKAQPALVKKESARQAVAPSKKKGAVAKAPLSKPVSKAKPAAQPAPPKKTLQVSPARAEMKRPTVSFLARPVVKSAPAISPRSQALLDKSEIADVLHHVVRAFDRCDETQLRSCFHADATIDLGPGVFQGTVGDYVQWVLGVLPQIKESHHMITNIMVRFEDEAALVESYCQAQFRLDKPTGREDLFIGSRFLDRLERRPSGPAGVWKIMHRKQILDWSRTQAVSDIFYHQNPDALWSARTKTDPSYQMEQFPGSQSGNKLPSFLGRRYDSKSIKF